MSEKPMTGKDVLKRIAPIAITLVLIVLIAIVVTSVKGCSNKKPTIDNPDNVYLEMGDLKITKDRLYTYLKQEYGLAELNRLIDNELYKEDMAKVDATKLDEYIIENVFGEKGLKETDSQVRKEENIKTWKTIINSLKMNNLISNVTDTDYDPYETDSNAWKTVRSYYKLQYARREWAKNKYVENLRADRKENDKEGLFDEEDMTEYFEANFSETVTAIIIPFTSEAAAYKAMNAAGINTTTNMLNNTIAKNGWVSKDFDYNSNLEVSDYLTSLEVYDAFIKMYNEVYNDNQILSTHYTKAIDPDKSLKNAVDALTKAIDEYKDEVKGNLILPTSITIKAYNEDGTDKNATIEWSVEEGNDALKLENGNKLVYTSPSSNVEIKVTAKVTLEENQTSSKTFTFEAFKTETADAEETITVEDAEAFEKYTFDTDKLTEDGINLLWDIKSLKEINSTLASNVIYISEDSSNASTLVLNQNSAFVKSYTMKPIKCGNYYFLALKAARAVGPNQDEKKTEIENGLIEELFAENDNNIDDMIYQRRQDAGLEIYDSYIEAIYDYQYTYFYETTLKKTSYNKFENSKKNQNKIVAKFTANNKEQTITSDQLFKSLSDLYSASISIDLINEYRIITSTFNELYNPYKDSNDSDLLKELLETEVGNFRKNFESDYFTYSYLSYYGFIPNFPADYGWKNFQKDYFGAFSDEELLVNANFGGSVYSEALTKLTESLYKDIEYSMTNEEAEATDLYKAMKEKFDSWYGLNVVNLIVGIDTNYDGNFEQQSEKDEETGVFAQTDWTQEQKDLAVELMNLVQTLLPQTAQSGKTAVYDQLTELVKVYNESSNLYDPNAVPTADDTIYTFNYFAKYQQAGLVLKLESSQAYDSSSSLVEEFLDALSNIYKVAKAQNASDTFEAPYTATCETVYGFHLIYATSFKAQTELPTIEDIKLYNAIQDAKNNADATLDHKKAIYDEAVKQIKELTGDDYDSEYAIDSDVETKITTWYTPAVTEASGNNVLSESLINYLEGQLESNEIVIKDTSIMTQAKYNELLNIIIEVSREDLKESENK